MGDILAADGSGPILTGLRRAADDWVGRGDPRPIMRWLAREVDGAGIPRRLPLRDWWTCLAILDAAHRGRPGGWPTELDARIEPAVRTALRFTRPDGSPVFGPRERSPANGATLRAWAGRLSDPGLETVANWWFPGARKPRRRAGPPLPAFAAEVRPLAVLRADWNRAGDLLAVDQRGPECLLELVGGGRRWLGPSWATGPGAGPARVVRWMTGPQADLLEWSFRRGEARVTRTAVLLRGRRLALLAEQCDGPAGEAGLRLGLGEEVEAHPIPDSRAIRLKGPGAGTAQIIPLGLPALDYPTDRGALGVADGSVTLRQPVTARRGWLPLLVSWDPARQRRSPRWRVLTVTEATRDCRPGAAFAARVAWGRGEGLVIYRSLARPALRCFLGHPTTARFLIGTYDSEGDVTPLLTVEA
jgi:hypothetical protein